MTQQIDPKLTAEQKRLTVTCSACGEDFVMDETAVQNRPIPDHAEITEYGLVCPHCDHWQHVMLDCAKLQRFKNSQRMKLQAYQKARTDRAGRAYNKAKNRYQAEFNRFHTEWRHKLNIPAPGSLLTADAIGASGNSEEE